MRGEGIIDATILTLTRQEMEEKLRLVFTPNQTASLVEVLDTIRQMEIQRAADTRELKRGLAALAAAQARTEQQVRELAEAQARTEQQVRELAAAQQRTDERLAAFEQRVDERFAELAAAQARTEQQVRELVEAQARTEQRIQDLVEAQQRTDTRVGKLQGWQLEHNYRDKAYAYFGPLLRRVRLVSLQTLEEQLLRHLSDQQFRDLMPLDLLVRGQPRGQPDAPEVWLAVEVSVVVDRNDVTRAQRRAAALRRAGYRAIPTVAGEDVTQGGKDTARAGKVLLLQDGRHRFWEEALAAALSDRSWAERGGEET